MRTQRIRAGGNCLKEYQRLFISTSQYWREGVHVYDIVYDSLIALVGKTKLSKNVQRFFCPSQIGITKAAKWKIYSLKDRHSLLSLLILFILIKRTIIIVNITVNANLCPTA